MGRPRKYQDPVGKSAEDRKAQTVEDSVGSLDVETGKVESATDKASKDTVSIADFKRVPQSAAKYVHPFDGYPMADTIKVGQTKDGEDVLFSKTLIVALDPKVHVAQDRSNKSVSVGRGTKQRIVNLETYHSRFIRDLESSGDSNVEIIFDRVFETAEGQKIYYAIVPSHGVRSQLVFTLHPKTSAIQVDPRYLLLDDNQKRPLRRMFLMMYGPQLKNLRMSDAISEGDSDALDSMLENKEI